MTIDKSSNKLKPNYLLTLSLVATGVTILANILWALAAGDTRDALTITGVMAFALASAIHARAAFGWNFVLRFLAIALLATFVIEIVGVATGLPFGTYEYDKERLGLALFGVPLLIPFAWFMMLYPSWLISNELFKSRLLVIPTGALLMSTWDLYLDPQMVNEGYWTWFIDGTATKEIPISNFFGWFISTATIFVLLVIFLPRKKSTVSMVTPGILLTWVWLGSFLVNIVPFSPFFDQPAVAVAGFFGMGLVLFPWAWMQWQRR